SRNPCVLASRSPASNMHPHTSPYVHASTSATVPSDSRMDCSLKVLSGLIKTGMPTSTPTLNSASASQIERCSRYSFHTMAALMTAVPLCRLPAALFPDPPVLARWTPACCGEIAPSVRCTSPPGSEATLPFPERRIVAANPPARPDPHRG